MRAFTVAVSLAAVFVSSPLAYGDVSSPPVIPGDIPEGMVYIPDGTFVMGRDTGANDERPAHEVTVEGFFLDKHEVTNQEFAAFVEDTGFVTQAEKDGYSWVHTEGKDDFEAVDGANWRHPLGPDSTIEDKMDHPVVCVSWEDAMAYARWAGKRLPTEAEWEYAARAGEAGHLAALRSSDNKEEGSHGGHEGHEGHSDAGITIIEGNVWQGNFPKVNTREDGYFYTAPVGSFEPNAWGVHDMVGNVWEWCADWYDANAYTDARRINPEGPAEGNNRVARGGSWFCSANYCGAYSTHYRGASPPTHTFNNVGFRCASDFEGNE